MLKTRETPTINSQHKNTSKTKRNEFWIIQTIVLVTTTNFNKLYNYVINLFQMVILKIITKQQTSSTNQYCNTWKESGILSFWVVFNDKQQEGITHSFLVSSEDLFSSFSSLSGSPFGCSVSLDVAGGVSFSCSSTVETDSSELMSGSKKSGE